MTRRSVTLSVLRFARLAALPAALSAAALGCGGATDADVDAMRPRRASLPVVHDGMTFERVYFDTTNTLPLSRDAVAAFDLVAGAEVELEVVTKDGSPLRYEILRVKTDGATELINAFHVDSGFTLTTFAAASDSMFVLHFPEVDVPRDVVVHMECKRALGRCAPAQQPGEYCVGGHDCDRGLTCMPADGACDALWKGGTCVRRPDPGACEPDARACGCDGQTYASACLARAAGVSVRHDGACDDVTAASANL